MIDKVLRYRCSGCDAMDFTEEDSKKAPAGWTIGTEVGDLCPNCSKFWKQTKQDFLERMKR